MLVSFPVESKLYILPWRSSACHPVPLGTSVVEIPPGGCHVPSARRVNCRERSPIEIATALSCN